MCNGTRVPLFGPFFWSGETGNINAFSTGNPVFGGKYLELGMRRDLGLEKKSRGLTLNRRDLVLFAQ